ncbi:ribokinase [Helcobacillus massiliensis]|uniref:ribokinase n=1 Tax=Helcobacillus massiliensis TaxID=521392 RepID=UPI002557761F|nr:ribokinase [Helcobacillus massiliensis]MDK7742151.1 ribokinase [Helcobacillus massiliensis]WOO93706.1 ribokinase [Helcobacillus massiliensis]
MTTHSPVITVIGSINADLSAVVQRHPSPGETLHGTGGEITPGGKGANQAVAAAKLGGTVRMVGAVGTDANSEPALQELRAAGVDLTAVDEVPGPTGLAIITVDAAGENTIIVVPGANGAMDAARVTAARAAVEGAAVVISQGEIPRDGMEAIPGLVPEQARFLLNPAPVLDLERSVVLAADPLVVNEHEAQLVADQFGIASSGATAACTALLTAGVRSIVLTLGADGAVVMEHGSDSVSIPAVTVTAVDTTGAGDAFIGALALKLADGDPLVDAARFAARVGAYAVTGRGAQTSYPSAGDDLPA